MSVTKNYDPGYFSAEPGGVGISARLRRKRLVTGATAVAVLIASQLTAQPASAGNNEPNLWTNQTLSAGQRLNTAVPGTNTGYRLDVQGDGNLVIYRWNNKAIWSSGTQGNSLLYLGMQSDGNAVLRRYDAYPLWASGTSGANYYLNMGADGNLVVRNPAGIGVWEPRHPRTVWRPAHVVRLRRQPNCQHPNPKSSQRRLDEQPACPQRGRPRCVELERRWNGSTTVSAAGAQSEPAPTCCRDHLYGQYLSRRLRSHRFWLQHSGMPARSRIRHAQSSD